MKKPTPDQIKIFLLAVVVVIGITYLATLFFGFKKPEPSSSEAVIKAKDETIRILEDHQVFIRTQLNKNEQAIRDLETRDSALNAHYLANQSVYIKLNEQLKNIPLRIAAIANNDDSIRAAFAGHDEEE